MSRGIDASTLLFFDASCLIAAASSPAGGSGLLLSMCALMMLHGAVSQPVLLEAERNIQAKLRLEALRTYHQCLQTTPLLLDGAPSPMDLHQIQDRINTKDAHVVAAATRVRADFLLTLDKALADQVTAAGLSVRAMTPGLFITTVLPAHVDYQHIRSPE